MTTIGGDSGFLRSSLGGWRHDAPTIGGYSVTGSQSADVGDALNGSVQSRILDAAIDTLTVKRVSSFTMEAVAERAGVGIDTIRRVWPNTAELFTATLKSFANRHVPIPDTGTLEGDLLQYARSYAATLNTPVGRKMLDAVIIRSEDWDLSDSRATFLIGRKNIFSTIIQRGIERGECPSDTDTVLIMDLLGTGLMLPVLFFEQPVSDEHCVYVVNTLLYGIAGKR